MGSLKPTGSFPERARSAIWARSCSYGAVAAPGSITILRVTARFSPAPGPAENTRGAPVPKIEGARPGPRVPCGDRSKLRPSRNSAPHPSSATGPDSGDPTRTPEVPHVRVRAFGRGRHPY
ncbi:hypothetical protein GCM10010326_48900 [Streptomyces xanthochromogenes]|uniref:Uncharacterized protein n=1 Tax=Streptomyces xanthochromogenes TaxID=67384 RepID=A0ABQ3AGV1_9ACTN|nr:hypothetical protein GCM10010326_48900 [Streptomyces xanthochromogenes]